MCRLICIYENIFMELILLNNYILWSLSWNVDGWLFNHKNHLLKEHKCVAPVQKVYRSTLFWPPFNLIHVLHHFPPRFFFFKYNVPIYSPSSLSMALRPVLGPWPPRSIFTSRAPKLFFPFSDSQAQFWLHTSSVGFTQHIRPITHHLIFLNVRITLCKLWSSSLKNFPYTPSNYF